MFKVANNFFGFGGGKTKSLREVIIVKFLCIGFDKDFLCFRGYDHNKVSLSWRMDRAVVYDCIEWCY